MGKYSDTDWYKKELKKYLEKYGDVPPAWIFDPNSHPYSIRWRMGSGETFLMVLSEWFESTLKTENDKINYFRKYPPPPRWLADMAESIWEMEGWNESGFDYTPYLNKLKELGFEGTSDYEKDLDDEKWLKIERGETE